MNSNYLPTKTNLIKLQESLRITKQGHELLERKRMILTKELEKYLGSKYVIEKVDNQDNHSILRREI